MTETEASQSLLLKTKTKILAIRFTAELFFARSESLLEDCQTDKMLSLCLSKSHYQ